MKIRCIASDLDGTLLNSKKELTPRTRAALTKAMEQGIHFIPATGRSFHSLPKELLELPGLAYVITSNGAATYSVSTGQRIYQCPMSPASVRAVAGLPAYPHAALEVFIQGIPYTQRAYIEDPKAYGASDSGVLYVQRTRRPVEDMRQFLLQHLQEVDSVDFVSSHPEILAQIRRDLEAIPDLLLTSSLPHMVEAGHKDGGKGKTLLHLLEQLELSPQEAAAFGDADNDVDLLEAVAYGYAMENATAACKKAAYEVTASNEEDGVGKMIEQLLFRI